MFNFSIACLLAMAACATYCNNDMLRLLSQDNREAFTESYNRYWKKLREEAIINNIVFSTPTEPSVESSHQFRKINDVNTPPQNSRRPNYKSYPPFEMMRLLLKQH